MAWADYWRSQIDGIEEVEEHSERSWLSALALILLLESRLRRKLAHRAALLPVDERSGRLDFGRRDLIRRFRSASGRDVRLWIRQASLAIAGRRSVPLDDPTSVARLSPAAAAVRGAMDTFSTQWARGMRIVARDEDRQKSVGEKGTSGIQKEPGRAVLPSRDAGAGGQAVPPRGENAPDDTPPTLPPQPRARDREAIDFEEIARDQLFNLLRAFSDEGLRVEETLIRTTGRFNRKGDSLDFLLGAHGDRRRSRAPVEGGENGWHLDRNRLKLSFASHVRASHRRRTVSEGSASGIAAFRLDVPASRLGHVDPSGQLGPHLWRVRTLDEWTDVQARANAGRIRSSSWDTLGFGFGDMSYIVAVPAIYLGAAKASGEDLRRKWL